MALKMQVVFLFAIGISACAATGSLQESHDGHEGVHCLSLSRIQNSEVLDNQHIVFRVNGGKSFLSTLPHKCPGLSRHDPYMYRTSLNQLCDLDIITVLRDSGIGLMPEASCGLGRFYAIDEQGIEDLKARINAQ
jgi:hypothetical protein